MNRKIGVLAPLLIACILTVNGVQGRDFFANTAKLRKTPLKMPTKERFRNFIGMEFARIEPGTIEMGFEDGELSDGILGATERGGRDIKLSLFGKKGDYDEHPKHKVTITKPFYMGVREVTNNEYELFEPLHMHLRGKQGFSIDDDEAVVFVSWHEAKAFCDWLSEIDGLPGAKRCDSSYQQLESLCIQPEMAHTDPRPQT